MENKYTLSQKENIFLAKKALISAIYNSARLEGINITFPQTKTILEGVSVSNVNVDDVQTILNLRNAWRYLLKRLEAPFDLDFAKKINGFVSYERLSAFYETNDYSKIDSFLYDKCLFGIDYE